jgi:hypothetical protein
VCLEHAAPPRRAALLAEAMREYGESGEMGHVRSPEHLLQLLLAGGAIVSIVDRLAVVSRAMVS